MTMQRKLKLNRIKFVGNKGESDINLEIHLILKVMEKVEI